MEVYYRYIRMETYTKIAENIIAGISNNETIADLLLKAKIYASLKKDKKMLSWIQGELEGYENKPPEYRILDCAVKVKVFKPFVGEFNIYFPVEVINDERVRNRIVKMPIHASITEVEDLSKQPNSILLNLSFGLAKYFSPFLGGDFQGAYQEVSPSALKKIIILVKDILLSYFLKVAEGEDIDFTAMTKTKFDGDMKITNSKVIVSGNDTHITNSVVNSENVKVNEDNLEKLKAILSELESHVLKSNNEEGLEAIEEVKQELNSEKPSKNKLQLLWRGLGSVLTGTLSGVSVSLISKGLTLIGLL